MASNDSVRVTTEPYPGTKNAEPSSHTVQNFCISTQKLPILKAGPIETMTESLGIAVPEMIFGDNFVKVEHVPSGWSIVFDAYHALDNVDKTEKSMLQVKHAGEWKASREHHHEGIKEVVKPFDWSYSTDFKGFIEAWNVGTSGAFAEATDAQIPVELLKRPDPIKFFDEVILYEDELADNGITMLSVKVRVMPDRLLLLQRFFMRLDDVMFRIRDTRVFIEFANGEILREYVEKEEEFETIREKVVHSARMQKGVAREEEIQATLRDGNQLAELLSVKTRTMERLVLPS